MLCFIVFVVMFCASGSMVFHQIKLIRTINNQPSWITLLCRIIPITFMMHITHL